MPSRYSTVRKCPGKRFLVGASIYVDVVGFFVALERGVILETIWGYEDNLGRTLDIHINTLRKKLGEKGKYIITVRNVGYKIEKEVSTNEA